MSIELGEELVFQGVGEFVTLVPVKGIYHLKWKASAPKGTNVRITLHEPADQHFSEVALVGNSGMLEESITIKT